MSGRRPPFFSGPELAHTYLLIFVLCSFHQSRLSISLNHIVVVLKSVIKCHHLSTCVISMAICIHYLFRVTAVGMGTFWPDIKGPRSYKLG
jgi:hypothetical protein